MSCFGWPVNERNPCKRLKKCHILRTLYRPSIITQPRTPSQLRLLWMTHVWWKKLEYHDKKLKKLVIGRESVRIHQHWWRRSKKKAGSQDHNASQCSPSSASCLSYQTSSPPHPHPAPLKSSSQPSQALPSRRPTPPGAFLPHLLLLPSPLLTRSLFTYKRDGPLDPAFVWVPRLLSELHFFWYFHILDISPKRVFHQKVA